MTITDKYGRPWEYLDALKWEVHQPGAFSVVSADGVPLCGRYVEGQEPVRYVDYRWSVKE